MPYDPNDVSSLPANVQKMSPKRRRQWSAVFNSTHAKCAGQKDCEAQAFRNANGVAKSLSLIDDIAEGKVEKDFDPRTLGIEIANIQTIFEDLGLSSLDFDNDAPQTKDAQNDDLEAEIVKAMYDSGSDANANDEEPDPEDEDEEDEDEIENKKKKAVVSVSSSATLSEQQAEAEKCMAEGIYYGWPVASGAPVKSFSEWDDYEKLQKVQQQVDDLSWRFQRITDNIMRDPNMSPQDKATAVERAAKEFGQRAVVDSAMKSKKKQSKGLLQRAVDSVRGYSNPDPFLANATFRIEKNAVTGQERWFSVYSNKWKDREGEILPESAHKSYVNYVQRTGNYPELQLWHTPGTRIGVADFVDYDTEGFAVASGTFDTGTEHIVQNLKAMPYPLAMSHGFNYTRSLYDNQNKVYGDYTTDEISILPAESVANTATLFLTKEIGMTLPRKQFLIDAGADPETISRVESGLKVMSTKLNEQGVAYRAVEDPAPQTAPATTTTPTAEAKKEDGQQAEASDTTETPTPDPVLAAIQALGTKIDSIGATVAEQADEIKALKATDDEKIAAQFKSKAPTRGASQKDSESKDTEIDKELADAMTKALEDEGGPAAVYARQAAEKFGLPVS